MTAAKLIELLRKFPTELEVHIEVNGVELIPTDVDMCSGGASSWLLITDFPIGP